LYKFRVSAGGGTFIGARDVGIDKITAGFKVMAHVGQVAIQVELERVSIVSMLYLR
jgi:hypothetical protein